MSGLYDRGRQSDWSTKVVKDRLGWWGTDDAQKRRILREANADDVAIVVESLTPEEIKRYIE